MTLTHLRHALITGMAANSVSEIDVIYCGSAAETNRRDVLADLRREQLRTRRSCASVTTVYRVRDQLPQRSIYAPAHRRPSRCEQVTYCAHVAAMLHETVFINRSVPAPPHVPAAGQSVRGIVPPAWSDAV